MALSPFSATWRTDVAKLFASIQTTITTLVVGPASSTNNNLAAFNGTTGKLLKDSGIATPTTGTFTPTVAFTTPGTSSFAYTTQLGAWTRTADVVTVMIQLAFTPTIGTGTGSVQLLTLPFAANASYSFVGMAQLLTATWTWPTSRTQIGAQIVAGTSAVLLVGTGSGQLFSALTQTSLTGGSAHSVIVTITYKT